MQQLTLVKRGALEWRETETPRITGANQALVRPLAVARCDLDIPIALGQSLFRPPFALGHEFVGEITALSEDLADTFKVGAHVAVAFQVACGTCAECGRGHSNSCATLPGLHDYGMGPGGKTFGGALADSVHVPYARHMLLPLPDGTDLVAVASLSDNIVEAWKLAGFQLEKEPGTPVLIMGGFASSIGLYTAALARAMGSPVTYVDTDKNRLTVAESFGADIHEVKEIPKAWEKRFPLVAECSGVPEGFRFCLKSVAPFGTVTAASIYWTNDFAIPYLELYNIGAVIRIGRVDSREMMPKVLHYIQNGSFAAGKIVSQVASWSEAKDAWLEHGTKLVVKR